MPRRWLFVLIPIGHALIFGVYWLMSGDAAGTVMSLMLAAALGLLGFALLPTVRDVGPTAPVDDDWERPRTG
jgi:hypothetical protein